ncbi:hypothetical protein D0T49_05185 [Paludibacter sp. 221]|uniref:hypothetical protein n=1 Tax=Paludibacter sp. 221 TaxID=2302939 RepID=UPI0013D22B25|nr:hypothetical protein [Paludibacter sp. 221]NDV46433.1 hypothetical protein [Paludibacter sp. 221]
MKKTLIVFVLAGICFFLISKLIFDSDKEIRTSETESLIVLSKSDVSTNPVDISVYASKPTEKKIKSGGSNALPVYSRQSEKSSSSASNGDRGNKLNTTMKSTSSISLLKQSSKYDVAIETYDSPVADYTYQPTSDRYKKIKNQEIIGSASPVVLSRSSRKDSPTEIVTTNIAFAAVRSSHNILADDTPPPAGDYVDPGYTPPLNEIEGPLSPAMGVLLLFAGIYLMINLFSRKTLLKKSDK